MRTFPECYGCLLKQAASAMNYGRVDQRTQIQTIKEVLHTLEKADDSLSPSNLAGQANQVIRELVGIEDLYQKIKQESHILAEEYLEDLRDLSHEGSDKLKQGLKISAAGNIIDVNHIESLKIEKLEKMNRISNEIHDIKESCNTGEPIDIEVLLALIRVESAFKNF